MRYPAERKEAILKKMLPPHNKTIVELAKEEGTSEGCPYGWSPAAR
jgi:transposase-like protein